MRCSKWRRVRADGAGAGKLSRHREAEGTGREDSFAAEISRKGLPRKWPPKPQLTQFDAPPHTIVARRETDLSDLNPRSRASRAKGITIKRGKASKGEGPQENLQKVQLLRICRGVGVVTSRVIRDEYRI